MGLIPWFQRLRTSPETILLLLAVLVGSGTGLGVVLFRTLIQGTYYLMFSPVLGQLSAWGHWTLGLIPLMGGLVVGCMRWRLKDFGPGLGALLSTVKHGRSLTFSKPFSKMVAAAVSLGSGASLGPEGPSVEIGANFSIGLGRALKVSQERQHLLLAAGAAAGLAAGFNAPIAGVFFALEVVLGTISVASSASVVLLAAVVAAWITQISLGVKPAFALPAYETRSLLELPLYVGLGVLASLVSLLFEQAIRVAQRCFQGKVRGLAWLATIPQPLHPLLGGLVLGAIALPYPQILGVGYETVESILQDVQLPLHFVTTLLFLKLVMTAISCGSGFVGGIFAPALFLGASLGSAYGKLLAIVLPQLQTYIASPPAYAMVGMAAVLASTARAPLTAILLLFELTQDYRIILPLMAAVSLSTWLVERLRSPRLDSDGEQQDSNAGLPLRFPADLPVAAALSPVTLVLESHTSLAVAAQALINQRCHCALVVENHQLVGVLTLQDTIGCLHRIKDGIDPLTQLQQPIYTVCSTDLQQAYQEDPLTEAIARMTTRGLHQLPVLTQDPPHQIVGLLTQEGISLAASLAEVGRLIQLLEVSPASIPPSDLSSSPSPESLESSLQADHTPLVV